MFSSYQFVSLCILWAFFCE